MLSGLGAMMGGSGTKRERFDCACVYNCRRSMVVAGSAILLALVGMAGCEGHPKEPVEGRAPSESPQAAGDLAALHIRLRDVLAETKGVFRRDYEGQEVDLAEAMLGEGAVARDRKVRAAAVVMDRPGRRCLVVDTIIPRDTGVTTSSVTILVANLDDPGSLERTDGLAAIAACVRPGHLRFTERYIQRVFAQTPPLPNRITGFRELAVLTWFDGRAWRSQVWTDMSSSFCEEENADFAGLMSLVSHLAQDHSGLQYIFGELEGDTVDRLTAEAGPIKAPSW